jgi:hypothetical protein
MKVSHLRKILEHYPDDAEIAVVSWEETVDGEESSVIESVQLVAANPDYVVFFIAARAAREESPQ